jgi:hypothetical protein
MVAYFPLRLLLHTETADGAVIPVWENVSPGGVAVLKEVMANRSAREDDIELVHVLSSCSLS